MVSTIWSFPLSIRDIVLQVKDAEVIPPLNTDNVTFDGGNKEGRGACRIRTKRFLALPGCEPDEPHSGREEVSGTLAAVGEHVESGYGLQFNGGELQWVFDTKRCGRKLEFDGNFWCSNI